MDYDDEYNEFEDYDYEDAAEDWEAEAELEEKNAKAEEAARIARVEEKLATRAPLAARAVEEDDEALPSTVQQEIDALRKAARTAKDAAAEEDRRSAVLMADAAVDSPDTARAMGVRIAEQILDQETSNTDELYTTLFSTLAKDFKDINVINDVISKARVTLEEIKREARQTKKRRAKAKAQPQDTLGSAVLEDKGTLNLPDIQAEELRPRDIVGADTFF